MPTGYTSDIEKGISFEQFVLRCARAFGACVTMRDDAHDTKIPNVFKPSPYHQEEIKTSEKKLKTIKKMTPKQCEEAAVRDYNKQVRENNYSIKKNEDLKAKYEAMIEEVQKWVPPSPDHTGLKTFMIEQLTTSITHDCDTDYYRKNKPKQSNGEQWKAKELKELTEDIKYHTQENQKEVDRCRDRSIWVQLLKKSLV